MKAAVAAPEVFAHILYKYAAKNAFLQGFTPDEKRVKIESILIGVFKHLA
jgi:hypothetical protein